MNLKVETTEATPGVWVLSIHGTVDASNLALVQGALDDLMAQRRRDILIDLEKATYISSSGFSYLIRAVDEVEEAGGAIAFIGSPTQIRDVFELLGLGQILSFAPDVLGGLDALAERRRRPRQKA